LPSFLKYEINEGRHILQAELLLTESPEFRLGLVKRGVVQGISSTSIVAEPDIVPLVCENEWRYTDSWIIRSPKVHIAFHTVHHQDCWLV